jgi:hypothetical protein
MYTNKSIKNIIGVPSTAFDNIFDQNKNNYEKSIVLNNPFNLYTHLYKENLRINLTRTKLGLTYGAVQQILKQSKINFLTRYFGPTGPGYNYGGATSQSYDYNNLNGISSVSFTEIFNYKNLYHDVVLVPDSFTNRGATSSFILNYMNNTNNININNAQTPGIAGVVGTTPTGSVGDRIK